MNKFRFIDTWYFAGFNRSSVTNDAADEIISQPDRHLLSQSALFDAEGGWSTFGLAMGCAATGALAVMSANPRIAIHLKNGQLTFMDWLALGGASSASFFVGNQVGISSFGDRQRYQNHWMAYTFVKAQNRFQGRRILTNAPTY